MHTNGTNGVQVRVGDQRFDTIDSANAYLESGECKGSCETYLERTPKPMTLRDKKAAAQLAYSRLVAAERLNEAIQMALCSGLIRHDSTVRDILDHLESL